MQWMTAGGWNRKKLCENIGEALSKFKHRSVSHVFFYTSRRSRSLSHTHTAAVHTVKLFGVSQHRQDKMLYPISPSSNTSVINDYVNLIYVLLLYVIFMTHPA